MQPDCSYQYVSDRPPKARKIAFRNPRRKTRGMNPRPPKAFVRVDIADAAKHSLIQQQSLDARAPPRQSPHELRE
jgi:hypothetical protein